jgi:hypothetical protein
MKSNLNVKLDVKKLLGFKLLAAESGTSGEVDLSSKIGEKIGGKGGIKEGDKNGKGPRPVIQ